MVDLNMGMIRSFYSWEYQLLILRFLNLIEIIYINKIDIYIRYSYVGVNWKYVDEHFLYKYIMENLIW